MILADWIGVVGVSMILLAFYLNSSNRLKTGSLSFILLNLIGASLACLAAVLINYLPFIILEGVWALVSLIALFKHLKNNKSNTQALKILLANLDPELDDETFVFISMPDPKKTISAKAIGMFREKEGTTYILKKKNADAMDLPYNFEAGRITLNVYSSLQDVGLTAAVSTVLANNNIPCNCIAGYHHDHLFVPKEHAQKALFLLQSL